MGNLEYTKFLLVAFLLIVSRTLYRYIVDQVLIFRIVHAILSLNGYYSRILVFPDLYSFGNVSISRSWSRLVPRFYNRSLIAELPPRLNVPNKEAKLIIMKGPLISRFIFENLLISGSYQQ